MSIIFKKKLANVVEVANIISQRKRPIVVEGAPQFARPDSQLVTASQIYEPECRRVMEEINGEAVLDRKVWEYSYIVHSIRQYATTGPGSRGLAFGCGKEAAPSIFAASGSTIVATDYVNQSAHGWEARNLSDIHFPGIVDEKTFNERVSFRSVDMNEIPADLVDFDFLWSTGSLEHIGGHRNGIDFVRDSMRCLKKGGIAVHTTEFVISSDESSHDHPNLSFYSKTDILDLAQELIDQGDLIILNFNRGQTVADTHVDMPPYHYGKTLAAHFGTHVITSIGLIIQRGAVV